MMRKVVGFWFPVQIGGGLSISEIQTSIFRILRVMGIESIVHHKASCCSINRCTEQ